MAKVLIHAVGLRDGLQVEKTTVPLEEKIGWVDAILASGIDIIQLGSFVNSEKDPKWQTPTPYSAILPTHYQRQTNEPQR